VLIGRALIANPRLLILDEPCAGLDPAAREHFLQFLQKLGRGKTSPTLILVTHHVEEILPVISHALLLKGGKTLAMGEKGEVMTGKLLSAAFSTRLWLQKHAGRYSMTVQGKSGVMV
jgi:iron complex transport system ATP-binding protein